SESGAPTRKIVGRARQSGASRRMRPRRSAMPTPIRKPPPRTITEARAAPSTPSRGNGPTPAISSGASPIESNTDAASRRNGVRVSPEARNVASTAKHPNTSGPPRSHVRRNWCPRRPTSAGTGRARTEQPAHPDRIDEVEGEVAGHHCHRGGGEPENDGPERPDGERPATRALDSGHGATSYRGRTPGVNERAISPGGAPCSGRGPDPPTRGGLRASCRPWGKPPRRRSP